MPGKKRSLKLCMRRADMIGENWYLYMEEYENNEEKIS
jgi:hypothetical protein